MPNLEENEAQLIYVALCWKVHWLVSLDRTHPWELLSSAWELNKFAFLIIDQINQPIKASHIILYFI